MLNKKLLFIALAAASSVAFAASSNSLKEAANTVSATSDSFAAAKAASVLEAEKRVVDRYDYRSKMDNSALHSYLSGVTTFNEYSQAKSDAVADANSYTDVLRQDVSSGQLSSSSGTSAPTKIEFVASKTIAVNSYKKCIFTYNSSTRATKITAQFSTRDVKSSSFTMPSDGVISKTVTQTSVRGQYITASYQGGIFYCEYKLYPSNTVQKRNARVQM